MTAVKRLMVYQNLLRDFQKELFGSSGNFEDVLESGLGYLSSRLRLENAGVFWWEADRNSFSLQYQFQSGVLMEGEEEIVVEKGSPLQAMIENECPVVVSSRQPFVAYIPFGSESGLLGAIRLQRHRPLPRGKILATLSPLQKDRKSTPRVYPLLEDLGDILSMKLNQVLTEERHRLEKQYLQAGSEVATAIFEKPRLRDMLESVSASIIKNFGFDRIRCYLIDPSRNELKGALGVQIPNFVLNLDQEVHSLEDGKNPLVAALMSQNESARTGVSQSHVAYVPIMNDEAIIGCLAVDNLLSQQAIDEEQLQSLRSLVRQIARAIVNARLFEDIEQQAITDGLTKLYVFRYFQQRLKEELDRADRYSYSVALVMMDVDKFKDLNDAYGHPLGDKVLEYLAQTIRSNIRRIDLAARYGGDEFVLVLPEITQQEAWLMSARLINALRQSTIYSPKGERIDIRVTMGIAMYPADARTGRDLIEAADRALYWAKKNNRGDICFYRSIVRNVGRTA